MQRPDRARLFRFVMVGALNTLIGYAAILTALWIGWNDAPANFAGFAVGLGIGFLLNRNWTFATDGSFRRGVVLRYMLVFVISYAANLALVLAARSVDVAPPLAHLAGIALYSICFYLGSARYVFVLRERIRSGVTR